ncbi:Hsp70 protein-domain-containing protein [Haematococcus lacustris]
MNMPQSQLGFDACFQEVSALLLSHLLDRAEKELAGPGAGAGLAASKLPASPRPRLIQQAVITVPAHFGPAQKQATLDAGRMAGLSKVSLLQEPVAAAMAYGFGSTASQHSSHHAKSQNEPGTHHSSARAGSYETLLVFDLGGGTFDVSLLEGWEGILEVGRGLTCRVYGWGSIGGWASAVGLSRNSSATFARSCEGHLLGGSGRKEDCTLTSCTHSFITLFT